MGTGTPAAPAVAADDWPRAEPKQHQTTAGNKPEPEIPANTQDLSAGINAEADLNI